ncbi:hypothetical protein ACQR1I_36655 [Bradyrhizobium sp. HKCCYLS2038]|uniref:hypothetical protein n=1 Tax=Bradyrhizobium sp. HKCCYLS2038 TaxID=3420764 RepID=UPI003EB9C636
MPQPSEFQIQRAFFQWLVGWPDKQGVPTKSPALIPGVVCWHTPNGGTRNAIEGKRLKESGVAAGIHDLLFLRPTRFAEGTFGLLFGMEWKKPGGLQPPERQLSPAQREMHPRLMRAGMAATVVVDNLAEAKAWCIRHALAIEC